MQPVETFLDGLVEAGFWDDVCKGCETVFADTDPWNNPDTLCEECREDESENEDIDFCPMCGGLAYELGSLGPVTHMRCRACHWTFQK